MNYPSATSKEAVELKLKFDGGEIEGASVREFMVNAVKYLIEIGAFSKLELPIKTTGLNYLIAEQPIHESGRGFTSFEVVAYEGCKLYLNVSHPRFFALRQVSFLFEQAGIHAKPPTDLASTDKR